MSDIYDGLQFHTHFFGPVYIWRLRTDGISMYAECRQCEGDETIFLSARYIRKLMGWT